MGVFNNLAFLLLFSFLFAAVFAAPSPLISYFNNTAESHACKPGEFLCAYTNTVSIDASLLQSCSLGGVRVLGLSDATNAHAEINSQSNYLGYNICMKSDVFSSNTCYYSSPGDNCRAMDGYNCFFGLSDSTNAHLSSCGVFGLSEIKFCCKADVVQQQCPSMSISMNKPGVLPTYSSLNSEDVNFIFSCSGGPNPQYDANILITPENLNFPLVNSLSCTASPKVFSVKANDTRFSVGANSVKQFSAVIKTSDGGCSANQPAYFVIYSTVTPPVVLPPGGSGDCNLLAFSADKANFDSNVSVHYSCAFDGLSIDLAFFDPQGNIIYQENGLACGISENIFKNYSVPSTISGNVFLARGKVGSCSVDSFFVVSRPGGQFSIPDSGLIGALAAVCFAVLILAGNNRVRKTLRSR